MRGLDDVRRSKNVRTIDFVFRVYQVYLGFCETDVLHKVYDVYHNMCTVGLALRL
jgi:hypothetical protein